MKFLVGYQNRNDSLFKDAVCDMAKSISEVYFPWKDFANGRSNALCDNLDAGVEKKIAELTEFNRHGIGLNLLMNGNCYGADALSREFFYKLGDTVDELVDLLGLGSVTTTSPVIAKFTKQNFPDLEVRASVNMGIGTIEGMDYLAELFDSFYLAREYNRDIGHILKVKKWCANNGKRLYGLANSGCLKNCSAHTFHDNLVAHEKELITKDNAYDFEGQCSTYLSNEQKRLEWLRITTFIRPEDIYLYEGLFDGIKLATRVNSNPKQIISAYVKGGYSGSLPDILEPNHSGLFMPFIIENKKIPQNFGEKTLNCDKNCDQCGYCKKALQAAAIRIGALLC